MNKTLTISLALSLAFAAALPLSGHAATTKKSPVTTPTGKIAPMTQQTLPLFYRELAAFDTATHGKLAFPATPPDYRFAAQTSVIPLLINEVALALQHYPLVFLPGVNGEPPTLAALVGLGDDKNRYVGADGQWRRETYIPAWVRRYPFLAVSSDGQADPVLALDPSADWLKATGGEALIGADGKPSSRLEYIIAFQKEFAQIAEHTRNVAKALQETGVLEEGSLKVTPPTGAKDQEREIKGFLIVSEKKLRELDAKALGKLHKADALGLAYGQLFSLAKLQNVMAESK